MKKGLWRNEFAVGIMVICGIILLAVLLIRAANWKIGASEQEIEIRFDYVSGLLKNAPVSMYGLEIGKVTSVSLMGDWVKVTAKIDKKAVIREGYTILIDISGVVGEKQLEIINGPMENPPAQDKLLKGTNPTSIGDILLKVGNIADRATKILDSVQNIVDQNSVEIQSGISKIKDFANETKRTLDITVENVNALLAKINKLGEGKDKDLDQIVSDLKTFMSEVNKDRERIVPKVESLASEIDSLLSDTSPNLKNSLQDFNEVSKELRSSTKKISGYIEDLNISIANFAKDFGVNADKANQKLQRSLDDLTRSGAELNLALNKFNKLVDRVENGEGTLGRLVKDETIYDNLDQTLAGSRKAIENLNTTAYNLDQKIKSLANLDSNWIYKIGYSSLSQSLQGDLAFKFASSEPYFYTAGLSVIRNNVTHNLQVGRNFGNLSARIGSMRSKASVGLDYRIFSNRASISLEGINITDSEPRIDINTAIRVRSFKDWYFIFGAEDLTGPEIGFNFGFKGIY